MSHWSGRTFSAGQKCVTDEMKALLAVAQIDADLAKFLSDGQKQAYKTNGQWFPSVDAVQALATFKAPGPFSTTVADINAIGTHAVVVTLVQFRQDRHDGDREDVPGVLAPAEAADLESRWDSARCQRPEQLVRESLSVWHGVHGLGRQTVEPLRGC